MAIALAVLALPPLAAAVMNGTAASWRYALVLAVLLGIGRPLARRPVPTPIQGNEVLVIAALAFILGALVMAFPLMSMGLDWVDAVFESTSAITTTGLTTLASVEDKPRYFLFARAWQQWYGGLGIVVLSVALLSGYDAAARQLLDPQAARENLDTSARLFARRASVTYIVLTLGGVAALWMSGLPLFEALTHALAAISTGGFSTRDASLAAFSGWTPRLVTMSLSLAGSVALPLYFLAWRHGWRILAASVELRALLVLCVLSSALLTLLLYHTQETWQADFVGHAILMATSAQTTTGFASLPVSKLDATAKLVLILSMLVGGSVGSTAGGFKLWRLLLLLRLSQLVFRRIAMPDRAVMELRLGGRVIEADELARGLWLMLLFATVVLCSWFPFLWFGCDPLNALFEVVSALATTGLSAGIASPELPPLLKGILCVDMLLGRLEIIAVLVLFAPRTWFGRKRMRA
ncbi:MAG: TrkH family potassium uptake protein [Candidatus Contendobacter sp.]|nr:TrkH family potassium uptake protein [Candidatus Contendobacter sp.]